jgi:hypothetical protein
MAQDAAMRTPSFRNAVRNCGQVAADALSQIVETVSDDNRSIMIVRRRGEGGVAGSLCLLRLAAEAGRITG